MGDREFCGTIRPRLKLPGNAACRFVCRIGKIKRAPLYDEKSRWVRLQNRAVSPNFLPVWGKVAQATRLVLGDFNPRTKEILRGEIGLGDRLPHALRRGVLNNYRADDPLGTWGSVWVIGGAHESSSSKFFCRSRSAELWWAVYLSIQRSWMRRIGTALR